VTVTGTPQLTLDTNPDAVVDFASSASATVLTFNYTVALGNNSTDLDYTGTDALALNGGTINDANGNAATLTLASPGAVNSISDNQALVIDGVLPVVSSVSSDKAPGNYTIGEVISIDITFNKAVTVSGTPQLTLATGLSSDGAITFNPDDISTSANGANAVYAADVDGDGDMDVLSASCIDDKIAWYENNGSESFTERVISTNAHCAQSVFVVDVDGDGDMDVLSASWFDRKIAWYKNDGSETFEENVINEETGLEAFTYSFWSVWAYPVDLDSDGDMDVLSAATSADSPISWYENDGSESFTPHSIVTSISAAQRVYAADMDGDGDMDLVVASGNTDNKINWYENNGSQSFTEYTITTSVASPRSMHVIDMDKDGDMDVLSASMQDNKIAWYENNGSQAFTAHSVSTSADFAMGVHAVDVDADGDLDILSASYDDDKIAWYENNGSESFTEHVISTSAAQAKSVYAADVDSDGDLDILSASYEDDKIAWYENPTDNAALVN
ncbi:uncharacterized protein METZ01_LOCUS87024, partial [marine metagenome]